MSRTKDRTAEFLAIRDAAALNNYNDDSVSLSAVVTTTQLDSTDQSDDTFLQEIEKIKYTIDIVQSRISELKTKYKTLLFPPVDVSEEALYRDLNAHKFETDNYLAEINKKLKLLNTVIKEEEINLREEYNNRSPEKINPSYYDDPPPYRNPDSEVTDSENGYGQGQGHGGARYYKPEFKLTAALKSKKNHYHVLSINFKNVLQEYTNVQENYKIKAKEKLKRDLRVLGDEYLEDYTDAELDDMIESGEKTIFDEGFIKLQENKKILDRLEIRRKEMLKLEQSMIQLRDLFVQIHAMVEEQGYQVNSILDNVDGTELKVEEAVVELKQAARYQSSARRKKIFVAICCVIMIIILVIVLCVTLIPRTN